MEKLYIDARRQWFLTQERKMLAGALLDSCLVSIHGIFRTGLVYSFMVRQSVFRSYADDAASSFSTFDNLTAKTKGFGTNVSRLPDSLVPIGKLDDVLKEQSHPVMSIQNDCLVLKHVSISAGDKEIIKDACCRIPLGSKVAVVGENGGGKSTLLKAMAGLYQCQDNKVLDFGMNVAYIPADELLFQGHTVSENISYGKAGFEPDSAKSLLQELQFHDAESVCGKIPAQLSGGEAKRVNIARGLSCDAQIILADEPTSCLDKEAARCAMEKLLHLEGRTVIYITHDQAYAKMADEIILVKDGEIKQYKPEEYPSVYNVLFSGLSS